MKEPEKKKPDNAKQSDEIEFVIYYGWKEKSKEPNLLQLRRLSEEQLDKLMIEVPVGAKMYRVYPDMIKEFAIADPDLFCDSQVVAKLKKGRQFRAKVKDRRIISMEDDLLDETLV